MAAATTRFSGRAFSARELTLIREIVREWRECSGLSRMELARTVCELLRWRRPNGGLKARECRELLERLDAKGTLVLPDKRRGAHPVRSPAFPGRRQGSRGTRWWAACAISSRWRSPSRPASAIGIASSCA